MATILRKTDLKEITASFLSGKAANLDDEKYVYLNPYNRLQTDTILPVPYSIRFYQKQDGIYPMKEERVLAAEIDPAMAAKVYYHPFYIKRTEVTNWEYREFIDAVVDSVIREILAEQLPESFAKVNGQLNYALEYDLYDPEISPRNDSAFLARARAVLSQKRS